LAEAICALAAERLLNGTATPRRISARLAERPAASLRIQAIPLTRRNNLPSIRCGAIRRRGAPRHFVLSRFIGLGMPAATFLSGGCLFS
jgi:hypothetical protein